MSSDETTETMPTKQWEGLDAVSLYSDSVQVDTLIAGIQESARSQPQDLTTVKGRKVIASTAHTVSRLKVGIDEKGKELVAGWKTRAKAVDAERKRVRDSLDALRDEVRKPLTDFEEAEKAEMEKVTASIQRMKEAARPISAEGVMFTSDELKASKAELEAVTINEDSYGVHEDSAEATRSMSVNTLTRMIGESEKAEAEASELERLRAEAAARAEADKLEAIKREAADKATREAAEAEAARVEEAATRSAEIAKAAFIKQAEAEAAKQAEADEAQAAQVKADAAKDAEIAATEQARKEAIAAKEKAELEAEVSVKRERDRVEAEKAAEVEAEAKRAADKEHKRGVMNMAAMALKEEIGAEHAKAAVMLITEGKVPGITIRF